MRFKASRALGLVRLFVLLTGLFASCMMSVAHLQAPAFSFAYDGQSQITVAYDGNGESVVGYDAVPVLVTGEKNNGTTGNRVHFAKFAEFLAADSGALRLTEGAQQTLAGTQNGVLLGTVENGQINLFQSGVGQIMGHSDLVNAGLVSPGAQGFSIGLESGQVTTLWHNSILNPASANYLLPAQTTQQILNSLGATGARLFP